MKEKNLIQYSTESLQQNERMERTWLVFGIYYNSSVLSEFPFICRYSLFPFNDYCILSLQMAFEMTQAET